MLDWDDLRYALAVAEHGSLAGAARALGVNHSTVLRRLTMFEERLGVRLFERLPTGYTLTAGGAELVATAREIGHAVTELERRVAGQDLRLTGPLRVTTTDTLALSVLGPMLAAFKAQHAGVDLELIVANAHLDLARRDADVAIRPARAPPETLVGRKVSDVAFAVYASARHFPRREEASLDAHPWVAPSESLAATTVARWLARELPGARVALRADSFCAIAHAALNGLGLAALPCYLGDTTPGLHRVSDPLPELATELWLLTHGDLRRTARVRTFLDFMADALARERDLVEGRRGAQGAPLPPRSPARTPAHP